MDFANNSRIDRLHQAIQALETQRAILGDDVVESSTAAIRAQLAALERPEEQVVQQRKLATVLFTDIPTCPGCF
jgi:hypothetical protein